MHVKLFRTIIITLNPSRKVYSRNKLPLATAQLSLHVSNPFLFSSVVAYNCRDRYHRILDLFTFRSMLRNGLVSAGDFVTVLSADTEKTLLPSLVTAHNITDFFAEYDEWQARIRVFEGFGFGFGFWVGLIVAYASASIPLCLAAAPIKFLPYSCVRSYSWHD